MSHFRLPITCEQFEANVSDLVDDLLAPDDRAALDAHRSQCAACTALHAEISAIVSGAATLPVLSPSRDLWSGIAERLDTPVVQLKSSNGAALAERKRTVSFRAFAAAAVLIVAASSGATYWLTRANPVTPQPSATVAATVPVAPSTAEPSVPSPAPAAATVSAPTPVQRASTGAAEPADRERSRYASNDGAADVMYERQITAMRRIVDERLGDLDSATVMEIERNLRIIDKAIEDSRRALQNDPRSRFLSSQLDRALESKLGVLRRIALL